MTKTPNRLVVWASLVLAFGVGCTPVSPAAPTPSTPSVDQEPTPAPVGSATRYESLIDLAAATSCRSLKPGTATSERATGSCRNAADEVVNLTLVFDTEKMGEELAFVQAMDGAAGAVLVGPNWTVWGSPEYIAGLQSILGGEIL